jgi:hypothetical protein
MHTTFRSDTSATAIGRSVLVVAAEGWRKMSDIIAVIEILCAFLVGVVLILAIIIFVLIPIAGWMFRVSGKEL